MTLRFDAGFDVGAFGALKITGPASDAEVTSGRFCHLNIESMFSIGVYSDIATQINSAMVAEGIAATVAYDTASARYSITANSPLSITAGVDEADEAHVRMGQVLGFSTSPGALAASETFTGDIAPYFMILSEMGGASKFREFEGGQSEDAETEDGTSYGRAPTTAPRYIDFSVNFEPRAAVFARDALPEAPWTWEHFYQNGRCIHPFVVTDDFGDVTVHKLLASSDRLSPQRVKADWRDLHDLTLKTRVIGRL